MSWIRNTAALAAGAALLLTPQLLPATAATSHSAPVVAPATVAERPLVQGVVTDQFGNYVDDVTVTATRNADGSTAATDLTYASQRPGGAQHGYFYLEVGKIGGYTLTLTKEGYETVEYDRIAINRRGQVLSLGEISIEKVLASTSTSVMLARQKVSDRDRGSVVVAVTSKATKKPTGRVEIRERDKVVGAGVLKASHQGSLTITLAKLGKGGHVLRAYYLGSEDLAPSSAKRPVTLVVSKSRK